ncbi:hypothetical protein Ddye_016038 [Dipteronia dyeriana]|uniref:G3BP-like protein n=1 Tax=Dipteronia dyeriana TaxID=168575 RepID=A0AAD9U6J8_9ROSI|nr:hypothetical protein Ddye_016038 [Dipteronia dyeriana]
MAAAYPGPVQVGSYFVGQYYQVLQQQPDLVHQFYSEASNMIRIDGDATDTASAMLQIHTLVLSLNFTAIEIKTINSLASWNGGVLVMVTGSVKTKDFGVRRKFVQTFFLAPQEKGYFVLNDIFQFTDEEAIYEHPAPVLSENRFDDQLNTSSTLPEQPGHITDCLPTQLSTQSSSHTCQHRNFTTHTAHITDCLPTQLSTQSSSHTCQHLIVLAVSDYELEEEAREYVNSVHIEDDPVDKYSLPEQEQQDDPETEVVEETPVEEALAPVQTNLNAVHNPPIAAPDEPVAVGEPAKKTWASILRVAKDQSASSVAAQPSFKKSTPAASEWNQTPTLTNQQSNYASTYVPESGYSSYVLDSGVETTEESFSFEEGDVKSVYVRNLPSTVNAAEIEQEFKNFGRIKPDGVFIRNRKDVAGVCYAFVEFEDVSGVQNAIQASPIQLDGRQVYIEERRPNSSSTSRGGRRGRGRGSYQTETSRGRFGGRGTGRGSTLDGGEYNRTRGNGYYQRS